MIPTAGVTTLTAVGDEIVFTTPSGGGGGVNLFQTKGSEIVQLNCAFRGRCGYADYETMAFDSWHGAREQELIQTHRAELLRRIRAGEIDGLFDPVPLPPKP